MWTSRACETVDVSHRPQNRGDLHEVRTGADDTREAHHAHPRGNGIREFSHPEKLPVTFGNHRRYRRIGSDSVSGRNRWSVILRFSRDEREDEFAHTSERLEPQSCAWAAKILEVDLQRRSRVLLDDIETVTA